MDVRALSLTGMGIISGAQGRGGLRQRRIARVLLRLAVEKVGLAIFSPVLMSRGRFGMRWGLWRAF